jgi:hypothetical protein
MSDKYFFIETVNSKFCDILSKISFDDFRNIYKQSETIKYSQPENDELHVQYKMLIEYCNSMRFNNYTMQMEYGYTQGKTNGRIFLKNTQGLQRLWSKFRGVLSDGILLDVDMINAHPTILLYICKRENIPCLQLQNYVNDRNRYLQELLDDGIQYDDAKTLFIKSINDSAKTLKHEKITIKNQNFIRYDAEMKVIQSHLVFKYPLLRNMLRNVNSHNISGRLVNYLMCEVENEILLSSIKKLEDNDFKVAVPMFDGCMIYKPKNLDMLPTILDILNQHTLNYGVRWDFKPHNTELKTYLTSLTLYDNKHSFIGADESSLAHYVNNVILKGKIYNCNGDVYLLHNGVWTNNDVKILLKPILNEHDLYIVVKGVYHNYTKNNHDLECLIKLVVAFSEVKHDFNNLMYESTRNKLCFTNGYYDFKTQRFFEYGETDSDTIYTTFVINRPYTTDKSKYVDIYRRMLYPMFNVVLDDDGQPIDTAENIQHLNYMKYILYSFARKIAGHIEDKEWMLIIGDRSSGKGILNAIFENSFGDYVTNAKGEELVCKQKLGEASKNSAWQNDFEFKRLIFIHEIPFELDRRGKPITFVDGNLIKQLSSGGDKLICRLNHKDQRRFNIQASLIVCCNDIPPIRPYDAMETVNKFNMPCCFLSKTQYDRLSEEQKTTMVWRPADPDLKHTFCKDPVVLDSFVNLIIEAYTWDDSIPKYVAEENDDDDDANDNSDYDRFIRLFEFHIKNCYMCINGICNDHILYNKDITAVLETHQITLSLNKANRILVKLGCYRKLVGKQRVICGVSLVTL